MPSVVQVTKTGPRTYTPAAGVRVSGGQVVEARAGGRIAPAGDGSLRVLGAALGDAVAPEDLVTGPTTVNGYPVLNTSLPPQNVAVAYAPAEVPLVFSEAVAFGQTVAAAANGQVRAFRDTDPDGTGALVADVPSAAIGRCTAPNGVSGAGVVGLVRLGI